MCYEEACPPNLERRVATVEAFQWEGEDLRNFVVAASEEEHRLRVVLEWWE